MESFAFWYKKVVKCNSDNNIDDESQLSAIMNFNLWCECGWKTRSSNKFEDSYLDIGFKIKNLPNAEELYFFIPTKIEIDQIEDLGCKFHKTELVDAVFNERHEVTIAANTKTIYVRPYTENENEKDEDAFYIYQLDISHDVKLEEFSDGTILILPTENIINSQKAIKRESATTTYYLRFRIKNDPFDFLIHHYRTPYGALQNLFRETSIIDFRYHAVRSLDKTLVEKFYEANKQIVPISAVHFLLITKAHIDVLGNEFTSGTRTIEKDIWTSYVDKTNSKDTTDLVAYHYAEKSKDPETFIESSELFAKFQSEKSVILKYLAVTIVLGVVSSLLASAIWRFLFKL